MSDTLHVVLDNSDNLSIWISIIFPIVVIAISLLSLYFSDRNNRKTLELAALQHKENLIKDINHNMRSVRPHLSSTLTATSTVDKKNWKIVNTFKNNGIGPALLNSVIYYYEGKEYAALDKLIDAEMEDSIWEELSKEESIFSEISYASVAEGESISLFTLQAKNCNSKTFDSIYHGLLKKVNCKLVYKSLYDEEFTIDKPVNIIE